MVAAVALRKENLFENETATPSRGDVLARYRRMREISKRHNCNVMKFLSKDAILHQARRLGLAEGKTLILDSMDQLTLAIDLAIHTAAVDRSRAIDRYARSASSRRAPTRHSCSRPCAMRASRSSWCNAATKPPD